MEHVNKIHVLVAAMHKSGSTWLTRLIANLPEMTLVSLVPGYERREQELSIDQLEYFNKNNYVAQHHTRFSNVTKDYLERFSIKPVILVRNIFDVVESNYDHFRLFDTIIPMAFVPENITKWEKVKVLEFIVDMMIPWHFNFYCSWQLYNNKLVVTYEELIKDTKHTLLKISKFAQIPCKMQDIELAIKKTSKEPTRLNIGILGRGENLPENLKKKIHKFAEYYPDSDFSLLGIQKKTDN